MSVPGAAREGLHALAATPPAWSSSPGSTCARKGRGSMPPSPEITAPHGRPTCSCTPRRRAQPCRCSSHPSTAIDADGRVAIMFRNSVAEPPRHVRRHNRRPSSRFPPARSSGPASWTLNACPMDGGAWCSTRTALVAAWRREGDVSPVDTTRPGRRLGVGRDPVVAAVSVNHGTWRGAPRRASCSSETEAGPHTRPRPLSFDRLATRAHGHRVGA